MKGLSEHVKELRQRLTPLCDGKPSASLERLAPRLSAAASGESLATAIASSRADSGVCLASAASPATSASEDCDHEPAAREDESRDAEAAATEPKAEVEAPERGGLSDEPITKTQSVDALLARRRMATDREKSPGSTLGREERSAASDDPATRAVSSSALGVKDPASAVPETGRRWQTLVSRMARTGATQIATASWPRKASLVLMTVLVVVALANFMAKRRGQVTASVGKRPPAAKQEPAPPESDTSVPVMGESIEPHDEGSQAELVLVEEEIVEGDAAAEAGGPSEGTEEAAVLVPRGATLQRSAADAVAAGNFVEALALYRRLSAANPGARVYEEATHIVEERLNRAGVR